MQRYVRTVVPTGAKKMSVVGRSHWAGDRGGEKKNTWGGDAVRGSFLSNRGGVGVGMHGHVLGRRVREKERLMRRRWGFLCVAEFLDG